MRRILAVSDEIDRSLYELRSGELDVDLIVSCGDLPFDYLEYLITVINRPLVYVPGNHDPALTGPPLEPVRFGWLPEEPEERGPKGGINADGRVVDVAGVRIAGLGGSLRYSNGPNQYDEGEMRRRALKLEMRARIARWRDGRSVDLFVAHAPPDLPGVERDHAHRGVTAFDRLLKTLSPSVMLYGHVHPHGQPIPDSTVDGTSVLNVVPYRIVEIR